MPRYRVWLRDTALQSVEVFAHDELEARQKVEDMVENQEFYDFHIPSFQPSEWQVEAAESCI